MKRILLYFVGSISIISMILLIMCGELPTDPKENPNNVKATFFNISSSGINFQDQPVEIGIIIRYPALIKRVRAVFDDNLPADTLYCDSVQNGDYDTVKTTRTFSISGKKILNIDVDLINGSVKQFSYEFEITPKQLTVSFDTVPPNDKIVTGIPDTMTFVASTSPAGGAIDFIVESQPVLDSSSLKILDLGSKAMVIVTTPYDTTYNISVNAKSGTATKTVIVQLKSEKKLILQETSSTTVMASGTSDTLVFTIEKSLSDIVKKMVILNDAAFKKGEIVPVITGMDTLSFVFTPAETKVYAFSFEVTINNRTDTLYYNVTVAMETTVLIKQDTVTISAIEGNVLNLPLVLYLADTTVQLSANKGAVNAKSLAYTIPFGRARDTVIITAQKNSAISRIKIYLNISKSDLSKPVITRLDPPDSIYTTGLSTFNCKVKVADVGAGVRNVVFTVGTVVFTDSTVHTDSIYQYTATGLEHGQKTAIKICATDKSLNKNSDSLLIYVTFDSTQTDTVKPVITLVNPLVDSAKVSSSSLDIEVSCTDKSGIDTVTCLLGTTMQTVVKGAGNSFIASVSGLVVGANVLIFTATDGSITPNISNKPVTVIYDPAMEDNVPPVVSLKNPLTNGGIVFKDSITVTISCKDVSGIATVTCLYKGAPVTVIKKADSLYSALITGLASGKNDTITFVATDSSTMANKNSFVVIVKYTRFSVTYLGNGNTGGAVPVDTFTYENGAKVIVAQNTGALEKNGATFAMWNTLGDSTGTAYAAGSEFLMGSENVTLHAQWTANLVIPPSIVTQPVSQAICAGIPVTFSVTASGTTPLSYQWRKGATSFSDIPEATGDSYSFTPAQSDNATILSCLVSNSGTLTAASKLCTLTVNTASTKPTAVATPASICTGDNSILSVSAGTLGTGATWKWYSLKTSATALTSTTVSPSVSTWYFVKGTGGSCGDSPWDSVYITVNSKSTAPASITASSATVCSGSPVTLTQAGGTLGTGATWQWFSDALCTQPAVGTPNADGSQFTVTPLSNTTYYVQAAGLCNKTEALSIAIILSTPSAAPTGIAASTPNVCPGNPVTLSVSGGSLGSGAKWKWYTNSLFTAAAVGTSTDISGSPITVTPSSQTTYYVRAEGTCGKTTGVNRTINVYTPPEFTSPLAGGEVCQPGAGSSGNYEVFASGNAPLTYTWYTTTGTELGSSHNTYISIPAPAAGNIDFYCIVTDVNGCSIRSNTATQTAHQPIEITAQPIDTFGYVGWDYTFSVSATGYGTLNYQWQYQLQDETWASMPLGTGPSVVSQGYFDGYDPDGYWPNIKIRCKITNSLGCVLYSRSANLAVWGI